MSDAANDNPITDSVNQQPQAGAFSMDMLQMMIQGLNKEVAAFKQAQTCVPTATGPESVIRGENSIPAPSHTHHLGLVENIKSTTDALKAQIEHVKKQIARHKTVKEQMEENVTKHHVKDASLDDIKASIEILKEHMESIIAHPIADIVPSETTGDTKEPTVSEGSDSKVEMAKNNSTKPENDAETQDPKAINAKAKDDMLKKYLLLKVVKDNLGILTAKMNKMLAAKGIEPANLSVRQPSNNEPELKEVTATTDDASPITNGITGENNTEIEDQESDEFYMYNEEEQDGEIYDEDPDNIDEGPDESTSESPEAKKGEGVKHTDVLDEFIKRDLETEDAVETKEEESSKGLSVKQHADDLKYNEGNTPQEEKSSSIKNTPTQLYESPVLADAEAFLKNYKKKEEVTKDTKEGTHKQTVTDPSRVRTYTLLLKLQTEMADMQLQMSRLQDHMRSTNAALQTIFDHEFSDM